MKWSFVVTKNDTLCGELRFPFMSPHVTCEVTAINTFDRNSHNAFGGRGQNLQKGKLEKSTLLLTKTSNNVKANVMIRF